MPGNCWVSVVQAVEQGNQLCNLVTQTARREVGRMKGLEIRRDKGMKLESLMKSFR